jgi:hypothetical protein
MDVATLVTVLTQLTLAASAYRLANAIKLKVENHEVRIVILEKKVG